MEIGLLIIDIQQDYVEHDFKNRDAAIIENLIENTNTLIEKFHSQAFPIIYILSSWRKDTLNWTLRMKDLNFPICIEGTQGEKLIPSLRFIYGSPIVTKSRYSAFFQTNLDQLLKSLSLTHLVICGLNTHACVRTTVIDAFMRDYRVFIPAECVSSYNQSEHEATLNYINNRIANVLSLSELLQRIETKDFEFHFQLKFN